jgi:hypothetical protein
LVSGDADNTLEAAFSKIEFCLPNTLSALEDAVKRSQTEFPQAVYGFVIGRIAAQKTRLQGDAVPFGSHPLNAGIGKMWSNFFTFWIPNDPELPAPCSSARSEMVRTVVRVFGGNIWHPIRPTTKTPATIFRSIRFHGWRAKALRWSWTQDGTVETNRISRGIGIHPKEWQQRQIGCEYWNPGSQVGGSHERVVRPCIIGVDPKSKLAVGDGSAIEGRHD